MSVFDGFARHPCAETLGWQLVEVGSDSPSLALKAAQLLRRPVEELFCLDPLEC